MARAIDYDPPQNFRFGVRLSPEGPWLGFSKITICPDETAAGPGRIIFERAMDSEFVDLVNLVDDQRMEIATFHITEDIGCADPRTSFVLEGVRPSKASLRPITFDAMGAPSLPGAEHHTTVLIGQLMMPYKSMVFRSEGVATGTTRRSGVARSDGPVVM